MSSFRESAAFLRECHLRARVRAGIWAAVAASAMLLSSAAASAENSLYERQAAAQPCIAGSSSPIPVRYDAQDGHFHAKSGVRFFASELRFGSGMSSAEDRAPFASIGQREDLEAVPLGPANRWGLVPAWIVRSGAHGVSLLQAELLGKGDAFFAPQHSNGLCAEALRGLERDARRSEVGLWQANAPQVVFSTKAPKTFEGMSGHYVIARGRVVSLGKTRTTRYLNFGNYWKTDFTATLKVSDEEAFNATLAQTGWDVEALKGRVVELRGTLQEKDGPHIALHLPEQLVVLEPVPLN